MISNDLSLIFALLKYMISDQYVVSNSFLKTVPATVDVSFLSFTLLSFSLLFFSFLFSQLFSYMYMENVINHWDQMGVLQKCMEHKLVYLETKDVVETTLALDNYKKACDSGRGAVFLSIARGKVAEGIDFDNHYGRCVVLFGIPYQYTKSHVLRARLDFMREKYQVTFYLYS